MKKNNKDPKTDVKAVELIKVPEPDKTPTKPQPVGVEVPKVSGDNIPKPGVVVKPPEPVVVKKTLRRTKYTFNTYHASTLGLAFHFSFFEVDPDSVLKKAADILGNNVGFKNVGKYHTKLASMEVLD